MSKTTLGIVAVAATIGTAALAADMPVKAPPPAPAPVYSWTGFYIGGNVGYGVARDPSSLGAPIFPGTGIESFAIMPAGVIGGVQAGYNWQVSNWLLGLETDFQGTGQKDSVCVFDCVTNTLFGGTSAHTINETISWVGTTRGRVGVAAGSTLYYATGGVAYGRIGTNITETDTLVGPGTTTVNTVTTRTGWAAGGGIETALAGNWTARIEYLYVDLGSQTITFPHTVPPNTDTFTTRFADNIIRAGVNYRIGDAPVAAASAMPLKAPRRPPPAHDWTGVYGGVNLGYGVGNNPNTYAVTDPPPIGTIFAESYKMSPQGVVGGGQIGANWQFGNWATGLEADIQGTSQSDSACVLGCTLNIAFSGFKSTVQQSEPWFGTVRGRFGATAGPAWLYVTGGLAYGNVVTTISQNPGALSAVAASANQTKAGWTAGGGIEAALIGNWSAKVEYLHVDLGSQNLTFVDLVPRTTTFTSNFRDNVYRAGLNYKFDWGGPIAMR
jgi:outer membrane immunogenic protein